MIFRNNQLEAQSMLTPRADLGGVLGVLKHTPPKFYNEQARKLLARCSCILYTCMGNEKLERARGIANLIQELLKGVQNYTFGVSLILEVAKSEIL